MKKIETFRTAIQRKNISGPAGYVFMKNRKNETVLDFGCGRGGDVERLRNLGYTVSGYDPHPAFGFSNMPSGKFDVVLVIFVLNVLPLPVDRAGVLKQAFAKVRDTGVLYVAVRPLKEIERQAQKSFWTPYGDGFITKMGTFQKGFSMKDLQDFCRSTLNLRPHTIRTQRASSYNMVSIRKPLQPELAKNITLTRIQSLVEELNADAILAPLGKLRCSTCSRVFDLWHDGDGGSTLVKAFRKKRDLFLFLLGYKELVDYLEEKDGVPESLREHKRRYTKVERIYCPVCGEDITNRMEWKGCSGRVETGRCPDCGGFIKRRERTSYFEVWEAHSYPVD